MSLITLLPVIKAENMSTMYVASVSPLGSRIHLGRSFVANHISRTLGGLLMFITGFLYLVFEESITRRAGHKVSVSGARAIMGVQVNSIFDLNHERSNIF
jgi:hypothetical protein